MIMIFSSMQKLYIQICVNRLTKIKYLHVHDVTENEFKCPFSKSNISRIIISAVLINNSAEKVCVSINTCTQKRLLIKDQTVLHTLITQ